jgi:lipid-A-disaccharide synthase
VGVAVERRFLIAVGEASGDRHAARLVEALRERGPVRVRGLAGPELTAAGVEAVAPASELAVIGFTGVLARLPRILRVYRRMIAEAERFRPDAAILVDSPGFNFRLGPALRARGIPVFYYIAPQVWAWHAERAAAMARWVNRLAVVFPFEEPLFREAGVETRFVGHPLLEDLAPEIEPARFRRELPRGGAGRLLGLLPGSRRAEFRAHAPVMLAAAARLRSARPDLEVALALAPGLDDETLAPYRHRLDGVTVVRGRTHALEAAADACVAASGTATLETALLGTPLAIVYRTGAVNWAIARRVVKLPRIGLPNIVAGEEVAPELLQDALTPERLAAAVAPWLDDARAREAQRARLARVRERLGGPGAARRAAEWLWTMAA